MNENIEELLARVTPDGPRPELRPQVLAAVAARLQAQREAQRWRWAGMAVAAALLLSVLLNLGLSAASDRRLAQLLGPPPQYTAHGAQLANAGAGAQPAPGGLRRWLPWCAPDDGMAEYAAYCEMVSRLLDESLPPCGGGCPPQHNATPCSRGGGNSTMTPQGGARYIAGLV